MTGDSISSYCSRKPADTPSGIILPVPYGGSCGGRREHSRGLLMAILWSPIPDQCLSYLQHCRANMKNEFIESRRRMMSNFFPADVTACRRRIEVIEQRQRRELRQLLVVSIGHFLAGILIWVFLFA